eukprot:Skav212574  [mRNA]  locus=scaffold125:274699:292717:- [translate_table: standard]
MGRNAEGQHCTVEKLLEAVGWAQAFFPALFEVGDAQLAMDRSIGEVFGGKPLDTSTDISSWAAPGTCVVTPLDDDYIQKGCVIGGASSFPDGTCFFRLDPPFGMEVSTTWGRECGDDERAWVIANDHQAWAVVNMETAWAVSDVNSSRWLNSPAFPAPSSTLPSSGAAEARPHGFVRADDAAAWAASLQQAQLAAETEDFDRIRRRLRSSGRLTRTECEALNPLAPPFKADGGNVVNTAEVNEAKAAEAECSACGGEYSRAWGPVNRWAEVVDIDVLRRLFENALVRVRLWQREPGPGRLGGAPGTAVADGSGTALVAPRRYVLGIAAPQIALPGRAALVRSFLLVPG